jgi:dCMP deaminase
LSRLNKGFAKGLPEIRGRSLFPLNNAILECIGWKWLLADEFACEIGLKGTSDEDRPGMSNMKTPKRVGYLSWDEYFMAVALLSAERSKDPNTQVGACIVNASNKIVGVGYNGFPIGCSDDELPWDREGDFLDTKYPYVCHAELNAVLNSITRDLSGCRLYVALFPCNECAKIIIQSGIKEIIYLSDKYSETDVVRASKRLFNSAGISWRKIVTQRDRITVHFPETTASN